ncbi:hypothetical protein M422DRAFT_245364 [Sphaerobolus stellatus SS14]|nr:hypothetical protein M422DRAFT_245364 [Sphaerobolus stellatus SS14]
MPYQDYMKGQDMVPSKAPSSGTSRAAQAPKMGMVMTVVILGFKGEGPVWVDGLWEIAAAHGVGAAILGRLHQPSTPLQEAWNIIMESAMNSLPVNADAVHAFEVKHRIPDHTSGIAPLQIWPLCMVTIPTLNPPGLTPATPFHSSERSHHYESPTVYASSPPPKT